MLIFAGNVYNKHRNMLLTTTPAIEDHTIREYKGVVFGEVITGVNFLKDFAARSGQLNNDKGTVHRTG